MFPRLCVWVLMASPTLAFAASKEILELQRDLSQLQQQVRDLQRSQDEKFAALQVLVQQAVDNASKANTAVAVIQSGFQQNIRDTESKVVAPVVGLASRMDCEDRNLRANYPLRSVGAAEQFRVCTLGTVTVDALRPFIAEQELTNVIAIFNCNLIAQSAQTQNPDLLSMGAEARDGMGGSLVLAHNTLVNAAGAVLMPFL